MEISKFCYILNDEAIKRIMYHDKDAEYTKVLDLRHLCYIAASQECLVQFNVFLLSKGVEKIYIKDEGGIWTFSLLNVNSGYVEIHDNIVVFNNGYNYGLNTFKKYADAILRRGNVDSLRIGSETICLFMCLNEPDLRNANQVLC